MGVFGKKATVNQEDVLEELHSLRAEEKPLAMYCYDNPTDKAAKRRHKDMMKRILQLEKQIKPSMWKQFTDGMAANVATETAKTEVKKAAKAEEKQLKKSGAVYCPHCKSIDVEFMQNNRKGFSAGKAVAGSVLVGSVGAVAGFAGKKGKDQWHCKNCGRTFEAKK